MKILVAISCMLAVASAGFLHAAPHSVVLGSAGVPLEPAENVAARAAHAAAHAQALARTAGASVVAHAPVVGVTYAGPQHIPVIGPNGVPLEPAENVAARAQHAAAHVEAAARSAAADAVTYAAAAPVVGVHYAGVQHIPVIGPNGVPLEPAANVAARAQHAAAHVEAAARDAGVVSAVAPLAYAAHHGLVLGAQHVVGATGVPAEPAENVAARAAHAAAHIEAKIRNGDLAVLGRRKRGVVGAYHAGAYYAGAYHVPVIGPNGVPLEPAANVAARAAHAAAHAEAAARSAGVVVPAAYAAGVVVPAAHTYPAIGPDGQPLETPEVVAAKSAHFAAHAEATARNLAGDVYAPALAYSVYPGYAAVAHGVPLDTPEVAAAKAAHINAHIAAKIAHLNAA